VIFRVLVLVCTATLIACERDDSPLPLVGTLERDRVALIAEASERIIEIPVREGDRVAAGTVVMRLDAHRQEVEVRRADAERNSAEQRLAELIRGPRAEDIRAAQARLKGAQDNRAVRVREHQRIADLVARDLLAENDLDRAINLLETADAEVQSLSASLEALVVGTTAEELGQAQAQLDAAEAALEARRIVVERLTIRAPRDGRIESIPYKLGAQPRAGETVMTMLAEQAPYARVYVPEILHARVHPGLDARVRVDGVNTEFRAQVRYVSAEAAFTPYYALTERDRGRLSFLAEVTLLDESAAALPSGVSVEVDFPSLRP
jgi:HlyD family secretion protein